MKLSELKPGQFFEFNQAGYCFGQCMYIGLDDGGRYTFVHQSAALYFFVLNREIESKSRNHPEPHVIIDVPQEWKVYKEPNNVL